MLKILTITSIIPLLSTSEKSTDPKHNTFAQISTTHVDQTLAAFLRPCQVPGK
jgi:hypothetical protein